MDSFDFVWWRIIPSFFMLFSIGIVFGNCEEDRVKYMLAMISESNSQFAGNFYQALTSIDESANFVISPFSLSTILTILKYGARGNTEIDLKKGLCLEGIIESELYTGLTQILNSLSRVSNNNNGNGTTTTSNNSTTTVSTSSPVVLEIVNMIYIDSYFDIKPQFLADLQRIFNNNNSKNGNNIRIQKVDFESNLKATVNQINSFINQSTRNKIPEAISTDSLSVDTKVLLINAIYFKGKWKSPFPVKNTEKQPFYLNESNSSAAIQVDMMHQRGKFLYANIDELDSQVALLPYENEQLSLIILLPNQRMGLAQLEQNLREMEFTSIREQLIMKMALDVKLPKMKLESGFDLVQNQVLKKLGFGLITSKSADFSGISNSSLSVSQVIQKTYIELTEEGSEAAVVSSVGLEHRISPSIRPRSIEFHVDHPFIAFIYDEDTKSILFILRKVQ